MKYAVFAYRDRTSFATKSFPMDRPSAEKLLAENRRKLVGVFFWIDRADIHPQHSYRNLHNLDSRK